MATTAAVVGAVHVRAARLPRAASGALSAGVLALIVVAVALHLHTGGSDLTSWGFGDVALAAVLLGPGAVLAARRPHHPIGWLLLAAAVSAAASAAGREYLAFGVLGGDAPGYLGIGWIADSTYAVSMVTLPLVLMLFPDGRPMSRRARPWIAVPVAAGVLSVLGTMFAPDSTGVDVQGHRLFNPGRDVLPAWLADGAQSIGWLLFVASILAAVVLLVLRYRRSGSDARLQLRWVVWAGAIAGLEIVTELIPNNTVSPVTGPLASGLLMAAVVVAVLRHRLFDIDLVINRTLVYGVLSVGVVGLYVALVAAAGAVLAEPVEVGPGLVATAVVALAFGPARTRLQRGVDRLLFGDRRNPYQVVTGLGRRLDSAPSVDELAVVVETVTQTLKLPYAAIVAPDGRVLAEHGRSAGDPVEYPLAYQGAAMGRLLVSPRGRESRFDRAERGLLDDLARQVGAAVHAVRLSADLQASRARLVTAKEEERRRLRRDLHDGLGPKLAALGLKVDVALALADKRPAAGHELFGEVRDELRSTVDDVRRLVYGLRPPALDELGLVGALREATDRLDEGARTGPAPRFVVDVPNALPPLPAAAEVAAYRIVTEAITNTLRHAHAEHCTVQLALGPDGDALHVLVRDDGTGLPPGWRAGVGTTSMRERAEELGGRLVVTPGPDGRGTDVSARIPCRAGA
jgi:signal transduction histidine kinase